MNNKSDAGDSDIYDNEKLGSSNIEHIRLLEAILFASSEPITERILANRLPEGVDIKTILLDLKDFYSKRGVNLIQVGKSWAFRTSPELAQRLNQEVEVPRKLSRAAIETLAITCLSVLLAACLVPMLLCLIFNLR